MPTKFKNIALIILLMVLSISLFGCSIVTIHNNEDSSQGEISKPNTINSPIPTSTSTIQSTPTSTPTPATEPEVQESESGDESTIDALYNDFYIGEVLKSGFVYIEPFKEDRTPFYGEVRFDNYQQTMKFYTIDGSNNNFDSIFDNKSSVYIPSVEEDSQYYWQGAVFGETEEYTLRYKISGKIKESSIGITFMNHIISNIDFSSMGKNRVYSESEHNNAVAEVKKSLEDWKEFSGGLRERTIDDSIVGAKQICLITIEDANYKMLLSKYFFMGIESTADVYVIDFIGQDGNVVKTFEKLNGVAY